MHADGLLTRREFLKTSAAAAVLLTASSAHARPQEEKPMRPNILFAIADDWSWPHAGSFGDRAARTPNFDRVAAEGILFSSAFCAAPSCTASRSAVLTGQDPHRLEESANLWSTLSTRFPVYPDILEQAGYFVGLAGKGWGPGSVEAGGRTRNAAGPSFSSFGQFLRQAPKDRPFCFWFGSLRPHRPYEEGSGLKAGFRPEDAALPPFLPDTPAVRSDLLDYYAAVAEYDAEIGRVLEALEESGRAGDTLVVVTSDNGMPFPRAKCNLYDSGTRMPLAVRWPGVVRPGTRTDELIGFTDFAPTFLEAAGVPVPEDMTGRSFLNLLRGSEFKGREYVFTERERHTDQREGKKSYPMRAARSRDFLYIRNLLPELWPAGDPEPEDEQQWSRDLGGRPFGDIDGSPTKRTLLMGRRDPEIAPFFERACAMRPKEELYDLAKDPWQLDNVAGEPDYADAKLRMRAALEEWMSETADPRARGDTDFWDRAPYRR